MKVVVLGSGVSGLSCAVRLLEAGVEVEVWARELAPNTTSSVAAAVWYPYRAGPRELAIPWAMASYGEFKRLAGDPTSGVLLRDGVELFPGSPEEPDWREALDGYRSANGGDLPEGYASGYVSRVPVVEMPVYLPFLTGRVRALGGRIVERPVTSFDEVEGHVVVNCTGLGSRELAGDPEVYAVRGQVVCVERGAVEEFLFDEAADGLAYVVPRSNDCVLGGTVEEGREDLEPDRGTTEAILARCAALDPRLARANVLEVKVGLRPCRPLVRLEAERIGGRTVVHDYGHGGAGVTLSWGCADVARDLVLEAGPA